LNSLLSIVNERLFANDGVPVRCPLVSLFGASNELPDGKELEALFDRFLLRFDVQYLLAASNVRAVLAAGEPTITTKLTMADLRRAQAEVAAVKITDETIDALLAIRDACRAEGIGASDRRWKKSLGIVRASAWLAGEKRTSPEDLGILVDSLWRDPKDRPKVARIVGTLSDPASMQAVEILDAAREIASKVSSMKSGDRKAYVGQAAQAIDQFAAQQGKLAELAQSAGRRARVAIGDAVAEIQGLHAELARAVSAGLGIGLRSVR
jgi:MoxR-like ATPase